MRVLGLDLGTKTLGLAVSDKTNTLASPLKTIVYSDYDSLIKALKLIVSDYGITDMVLGLPKNMNGTIGPKGELSYKFKEMLEEKLNLEVILEDERLYRSR